MSGKTINRHQEFYNCPWSARHPESLVFHTQLYHVPCLEVNLLCLFDRILFNVEVGKQSESKCQNNSEYHCAKSFVFVNTTCLYEKYKANKRNDQNYC